MKRKCNHSKTYRTSVFDGSFWRNRNVTRKCGQPAVAAWTELYVLCADHAADFEQKFPDQRPTAVVAK